MALAMPPAFRSMNHHRPSGPGGSKDWPKRIGVAGLLHESNTFVRRLTNRQHFADTSLDIGPDLIRRWRGTHHELGGFLDGAEMFDFEPVPLLAAVAMPSGPLEAATFDGLVDQIVEAIGNAGRLDGILLALHGATVAEHDHDADGQIVSRVRERVGPDLPVVMTLDLHANISDRMIAGTTATVVYRTTPHVDQRDRGREAAGIIARTVRGQVHPVQALERLPMIMAVTEHDTSREPAASLMAEVEQLIGQPGILSASVGYGFAWADVAELGTSVVVVADADARLARQAAGRLAGRIWARRDQFVGHLPSVADAVRQAAGCDRQPVVISDVGDNVGAGAPGDSTILFRQILDDGLDNSLVVLFDPDAVARCVAAGVRSQVDLEVGARTDERHGRPVHIKGRVCTISDGCFTEPQARHGGRTHNNQGLSVVLETDWPRRGHTVVLTSLRMAPLSLHQILSLGIDPAQKKCIIVKAVVAPRAAYGQVAARFIMADTLGATSMNLASFAYRYRHRPMFPFEPDAAYAPIGAA